MTRATPAHDENERAGQQASACPITDTWWMYISDAERIWEYKKNLSQEQPKLPTIPNPISVLTLHFPHMKGESRKPAPPGMDPVSHSTTYISIVMHGDDKWFFFKLFLSLSIQYNHFLFFLWWWCSGSESESESDEGWLGIDLVWDGVSDSQFVSVVWRIMCAHISFTYCDGCTPSTS